MDRCWYVIANAARARILERTTGSGAFGTVADLVHAESRQRRAALAADRPGHVAGPARGGPGGADFAPRTDPQVRERERFAREVAEAIDRGAAELRFTKLVLVASNPFLGALQAKLGAAAAGRVVRVVQHDYTTLDEAALAERLRAAMAPQ
jgi:protein required for attachment to host cells